MFVDTHVHLNDETLYEKIIEVLNKAQTAGVSKFFVVGYDKKTSILAINIAKKYNNCFAIIGYHPTEVKDLKEEDYLWLEENATKENKVIAIGECGYDFHWDKTTKEEQYYAFVKQIQIAKKLNLPLSIHSRDAIQITLDTLKEQHAEIVGGVMHSFAGTKEMAREYIKLNFVFGISGPVTFKNGRTMREVVETIDIKYLISETDSPYLSPEPYRGKENGPHNIPIIVSKIAELKNITIEETSKKINENVFRIFGV